MPNFNNPKEIMEYVTSDENKNRISSDYQNYMMYNGQLTKLILDAIKKEYLKPNTIESLSARIVPINVTQKIIGKLAQVYRNPPIRKVLDKNEADQELVDFYVKEWNLNRVMKFANAMFKNNKAVMVEPFLSYEGIPSQRAIPSYNFTVISNDMVDPTRMTGYIKHWKVDHTDKKNNRYVLWTESEHLILNEDGDVMTSEMLEYRMDGTNPYACIPATYIKDSEDRLVPLVEEDLPKMQLLLNILMSDLALASKFQCWSIISVTAGDGQSEGGKQIEFNPNSVVFLPEGSKIDVVKPQVDIPQMLQEIKEYLGMLLSAKGLKASGMDGLSADNAGSGISKVIDSSETTEAREDQEAFFRSAEEDMWYKFAHKIHPIWSQSKEIHPEYKQRFSDEFEISIMFQDMGIPITPSQKIDDCIKLVNAGLISKNQALKEIYPDLDDDQIKQLLLSVNKEGVENMKFFQRNMPEEKEQEYELPEDKEQEEEEVN